MNTLPAKLSGEVIEKLALSGDVSGLNRDEKIQYYIALCERVGLDSSTQPFKLLKLQGKEVFYCDRGGAQQLSRVHGVSHAVVARETVNDCYVVTARAFTKERQSESIGAVPIKGLAGEALCNAMMKGETKAKRRATLDLLGLGMLDETEVGTIPGAVTEALNAPVARLSASTAPPAHQNAPTAPPTPKSVPLQKAVEATEVTRKWFLDRLVDYESAAILAYMQEIGWLMPNEEFSDISLSLIPTTNNALREWMSKFETWRDGDVAPVRPAAREKLELPDSRERVTGVIAMVSKKDGQSKKGPWTLYGIKVGDTFYNTFDHKIGDAATERKGSEATVYFEQTERGFNALEVV